MLLIQRLRATIYRLRRRIATGAVALLAVMLLVHVVFGDNGMLEYSNKRTEYKKLEQELKSLRDENERLNGRIKSLRTDPATIEKEAREQLKYARPGEVIYTLPQPEPPKSATAKKQ
jgi:cell division protein FtsB